MDQKLRDLVRNAVTETIKPLTDIAIRKSAGKVEDSPKNQYFSIAKYIRGAMYGNWETANFEKDQFVNVNKAYSTRLGSAGGFLIPPEYSNQLIELLRAKAVVRNMGISTYDMNSDTLVIPKQKLGASVYWVERGSGAEITDGTPSGDIFGQLKLVLKE